MRALMGADELPAVSVIVAVYNAQDTIRDCIESLLHLDYPGPQHELIVVDNGSRDATRSILETYGAKLTILHEPTRGPAAARNTGLRGAGGALIAFTDADCVVDRQWLHRLVTPLRDPTVGVVGGRNLARRPCNRIAEFGERIHDHRRAIQDLVPPYAITMNWASRRTVLDEVGAFNPSLLRCSDVDLAYRLLQRGYRLVYEPTAVIYHRNRSTVWTLVHEGYRHGYYGVRVHKLHAKFLSTFRPRCAARGPHYVVSVLRRGVGYPFRFPSRTGVAEHHELPWAWLFDLGKSAGRLHGTLAALARPRRGEAKADPAQRPPTGA